MMRRFAFLWPQEHAREFPFGTLHSCGEFRIIGFRGDCGDFQTMFDDHDVVARSDVLLIGRTAVHPQFQIAVSLRFRVKKVGCPGIETEHVRKYLQIVAADTANRLVFGIGDDSRFQSG